MKSFETSTEVNEYTFVKFDNDGKLVNASDKTDNIIGITNSLNTLEGDCADVYMAGEEAEVKAGGSFDAGDALTADENGCAVKAEYGDNIGAVAHAAAEAGDVVRVTVCVQRFYEAPEAPEQQE